MADDSGLPATASRSDQGPTSPEVTDTEADGAAKQSNGPTNEDQSSPSPAPADDSPFAYSTSPAEKKSSIKTSSPATPEPPGERKSMKSDPAAPGDRKSMKSDAAASAVASTATDRKESQSQQPESKPESRATSKVPSAKSSSVDQTKSALEKKSSAMTGASAEAKRSQQFYQGPFAKIAPFDKFHFVPKDEKTEVLEKLKIENTGERVILFKIKTTAPEGYRVRPSLGIVQPKATGEVDIYLQPGRIKRASEDRFLVMVMQTDSDSMTQQQIAEAFKNVNKEQNKTMEHRLSCQVGSETPKEGDGGPLKTPRGSRASTGTGGGGAGGRGGRRLAAVGDLLKKLRESLPDGGTISKVATIQGALAATCLASVYVFYAGYFQGIFGQPAVPHGYRRMKACWPWS